MQNRISPKRHRLGLAALASAAAVYFSVAPASAYLITATDLGLTGGNPAQEEFKWTIAGGGSATSFGLNWHAATNGSGGFVDATGTITVQAFSTSELKLQVSLSNNSTFPSDATLTQFGLDVDPSVTGVSISGGTYFTKEFNSNFPAFQEVDVCATGGNNCAGGSINNGIPLGKSDTFVLDLTAPIGTFGINNNNLSVDLEFIPTKWQGGNPLSFELAGHPASTPVPEPASLAIFGTALAGLSLIRRRRRSV